MTQERITLFYLARGADPKYLESVERFCRSYQNHAPGIDHRLHVIFKGFDSQAALAHSRAAFHGLDFEEIHTGDDSFDLGAYAEALGKVDCDRVIFLNTNSEIVSARWLAKLNVALSESSVGIVGAFGNFETGATGVQFPNPHIRTNAFMMHTPLARRVLGNAAIRSKHDAYMLEHGPDSITRQVVALGLAPRVVGANGRSYAPEWWGISRTFRQGDQNNLLVADNQSRAWDAMTWPERCQCYHATWGPEGTSAVLFSNDSM